MTKPYNIIDPSIMSSGISEAATLKNEISHDQFLEKISGLLLDSKRGARTDFVTDKIFALTQKNPTLAKALGFPSDWKSIRNDIVLAASVKTDMVNGTTTFDPRPEDPDGKPFTIESHNNVTSSALEGAQDPFTTDDVDKRVRTDKPDSYGPPGAYIETYDSRGRDVHGGGDCNVVPEGHRQDAKQGWCPTLGCTRGQNQDIIDMANKIEDFKQRHPGVKIPYERF